MENLRDIVAGTSIPFTPIGGYLKMSPLPLNMGKRLTLRLSRSPWDV